MPDNAGASPAPVALTGGDEDNAGKKKQLSTKGKKKPLSDSAFVLACLVGTQLALHLGILAAAMADIAIIDDPLFQNPDERHLVTSKITMSRFAAAGACSVLMLGLQVVLLIFDFVMLHHVHCRGGARFYISDRAVWGIMTVLAVACLVFLVPNCVVMAFCATEPSIYPPSGNRSFCSPFRWGTAAVYTLGCLLQSILYFYSANKWTQRRPIAWNARDEEETELQNLATGVGVLATAIALLSNNNQGKINGKQQLSIDDLIALIKSKKADGTSTTTVVAAATTTTDTAATTEAGDGITRVFSQTSMVNLCSGGTASEERTPERPAPTWVRTRPGTNTMIIKTIDFEYQRDRE